MARYRKVETSTMCDERVRKLSRPQPNGQSLWMYLLTGQRTISIPGVVVAREAVAADDLGWSVEGFRSSFAEVSSQGMAKADWNTGLILLPKAFLDRGGTPREANRPANPNVVRGWAKQWPDIPECELKHELHRMLGSFCEALGPTFAKAFLEAFGQPSPIQEQEQEQEEERERAPSPGSIPDTSPKTARDLDRRLRAVTASWRLWAAACSELRACGIDTRDPGAMPTGDPAKEIGRRIDEAVAAAMLLASVDPYGDAELEIAGVIAAGAAEARELGHGDYLGPRMWTGSNYAEWRGATPEQVVDRARRKKAAAASRAALRPMADSEAKRPKPRRLG